MDPVEVDEKVSLDFQQVITYCQNECSVTNPNDVTDCTNTCFNNIIATFAAGLK